MRDSSDFGRSIVSLPFSATTSPSMSTRVTSDVFVVINKYDVRALARGDGAELVIHLEALGAVDA